MRLFVYSKIAMLGQSGLRRLAESQDGGARDQLTIWKNTAMKLFNATGGGSDCFLGVLSLPGRAGAWPNPA